MRKLEAFIFFDAPPPEKKGCALQSVYQYCVPRYNFIAPFLYADRKTAQSLYHKKSWCCYEWSPSSLLFAFRVPDQTRPKVRFQSSLLCSWTRWLNVQKYSGTISNQIFCVVELTYLEWGTRQDFDSRDAVKKFSTWEDFFKPRYNTAWILSNQVHK